MSKTTLENLLDMLESNKAEKQSTEPEQITTNQKLELIDQKMLAILTSMNLMQQRIDAMSDRLDEVLRRSHEHKVHLYEVLRRSHEHPTDDAEPDHDTDHIEPHHSEDADVTCRYETEDTEIGEHETDEQTVQAHDTPPLVEILDATARPLAPTVLARRIHGRRSVSMMSTDDLADVFAAMSPSTDASDSPFSQASPALEAPGPGPEPPPAEVDTFANPPEPQVCPEDSYIIRIRDEADLTAHVE